MKINTFTSILCIILSAVITYFLASYQTGNQQVIIGIGSFITLCASSMFAISLSFEYSKTTTLTRTTSSIIFILSLAAQAFFSFSTFKFPVYLLVNTTILVALFLINYGIARSKH